MLPIITAIPVRMEFRSGVLFSVLASIVILAQAEDPDEAELRKLKRYQLECLEETRLDPDLLLKAKTGKFKLRPVPTLKMWALCTLMKAELMTAEGVYRYDTAMSRIPPEAAAPVGKAIDKCLSTKALPAVDIAYQFVTCYISSKGKYSQKVSIV